MSLENRKYVMQVEYDFAKEGGAVGDIDLLRGHRLPAGAVVTSGVIDIQTAFTSGGSATVALKLKTAADVLAATAVGSMGAGLKDTVPDGTAAKMIKTTAAANLVMTVAVAALTAGKAVICLEYYLTA